MSIQLETITTRLPELEAVWQRKTDAAESYADAIKHVAEAAKIEPGALKAYINAKCRDKLEKLERESEQLSLMLDELTS
jgi:IS1 family transposase